MPIKAYKGFNKDMTCRGFQFKEGESYEEPEAKLCESGFHACLNPLDCWSYYDFMNSEFHEVEMDDVSDERNNDTKVCAKKIKIGAKLDIRDIISASIEFVHDSVKDVFNTNNKDNGYAAQIGSSGDAAKIGSSGDAAQIGSSGDAAKIGSSGRYAQIGSSGDAAQIGSSGDDAQIGSSGDAAQIGSSGHDAQIGSSGHDAQIGSSGHAAKIGSSGHAAKIGSSGRYAQIGSSGDAAQIGSSGYDAKIGSSGDDAQIGSSGRYAKIGSSGDDAKIICEADHAVVVCAGKRARIKAPIGTWITLSEYGKYDGQGYPCTCVKSAKIDGETLKPDTWYKLENGEFVECEEDAE